MKCKSNLDKLYENERKALLEGTEETLKLKQQKTKQELLQTTERLTEVLHRTTHRMASETQRNSQILTE